MIEIAKPGSIYNVNLPMNSTLNYTKQQYAIAREEDADLRKQM
jgi:hypothetical protein